ncbi:hypothetical protein C0J52_05220 [Blattella germanica]|nr:hypothetical protein C0J52_05220 [Blattella germanica]
MNILTVLLSLVFISISEQSNTTLSRQKRYLVYPPGSILQLGYCLTIRSIIPNRIFAHGFTLGTNWELPSETIRRKYFKAEVVHRMDRRDLYNKLIPMMQMLPRGDVEEDFDTAHRSKGNCAELFSACAEEGLELDYF